MTRRIRGLCRRGHLGAGCLFDLAEPTPYTGKSAVSVVCSATHLNLLPPRSMVGLATLTRSIGVRIPGGQPRHVCGAVPVTRFESLGATSCDGMGAGNCQVTHNPVSQDQLFGWSHQFRSRALLDFVFQLLSCGEFDRDPIRIVDEDSVTVDSHREASIS